MRPSAACGVARAGAAPFIRTRAAGLGLASPHHVTSEEARSKMVELQLAARGIANPKVGSAWRGSASGTSR